MFRRDQDPSMGDPPFEVLRDDIRSRITSTRLGGASQPRARVRAAAHECKRSRRPDHRLGNRPYLQHRDRGRCRQPCCSSWIWGGGCDVMRRWARRLRIGFRRSRPPHGHTGLHMTLTWPLRLSASHSTTSFSVSPPWSSASYRSAPASPSAGMTFSGRVSKEYKVSRRRCRFAQLPR